MKVVGAYNQRWGKIRVELARLTQDNDGGVVDRQEGWIERHTGFGA